MLIDTHLDGSVPAWSVHGTDLYARPTPGRLNPATVAQHADPMIHLAVLLDSANQSRHFRSAPWVDLSEQIDAPTKRR